MSSDSTCLAYGRYLIQYDAFNRVLAVAIGKASGLRLAHAAVLTSQVQAKSRPHVLRALLQQDSEAPRLVQALGEFIQERKRQPVAAGTAALLPEGLLQFTRGDVSIKAGSPVSVYEAAEIDAETEALVQLADLVCEGLDIQPADLEAYQRALTDVMGKRRKPKAGADAEAGDEADEA